MKARKKFLAGILTVLLCVACLSAAAFADSDSLPQADGNGVITLTEDVTISSGFPTSGTIDLNGHTLTYTGRTSVTVAGTDALTITDNSGTGTGTLVLDPGITDSSCYLVAEGSVTLSNITVTSTGSVVYAKGDGTDTSPSKVVIDNCEITTSGTYCVGTNASPNGNGGALYSGVDITIKNSTVTGEKSDGDDCMVMINVTGTLTIENSTITGNRQAVVVRAGEATITDSELVVTGDHEQALYLDTQWGSGNEFPSAALVVGSLNGTYYGNASVTVTDTTIESQNENNSSAVYVESNDSSKTTDPSDYTGSVSLTGSETVVSGKVTTGQDTDESSTIEVTGGTYDTDVSEYVESTVTAVSITTDDGNGGTTTTYSYGESVATAIEAAESGSTVTVTQGSVDFDTLSVASEITVTVASGAEATVNGVALTEVGEEATTHNYVATVLKAGNCKEGTTGIVKYVCADCGVSYYAVESADYFHVYNEDPDDVVAATCGTDGAYIYTCTVCGEQKSVTIPATGEHTYVETVIDATCTTAAQVGYQCSVCGAEDENNPMEEVGTATGHVAGKTETLDANCDHNAQIVTYCSVCGEIMDDLTEDLYEASVSAGNADLSLKKTEHEYGDYVSNGDGTHSRVCELCGYEDKDDCSYTNETTAATCGSYASTTYTCTVCGYSYTEYDEAGGYNADNHELVNETVLKEATCTTTGIVKETCACGATSTYSVLPLEHDYVIDEENTTATCTESGTIAYVCSICGATTTKTGTLEHSWDSGVVTTEATCGNGEIVYTCTVCGTKETKTIPGTGEHSFEDDYVLEATCTEDAVIGKICTVCGYYDDDDVETLTGTATGHTAGETEYTAPTCTEPAYAITICTVCGEVLEKTDLSETLGSEYASLGGHTFETDEKGNAVYVINEDGTHSQYCTVCKSWIESNCDYESVETDATCQNLAYTTYTCKDCGYVYVVVNETSTLDPDTHEYEDVVIKAATCTTNGIVKKVCACGATDGYNVIPAEHDYKLVSNTATCKDDGIATYECTVCGATYTEEVKASNEYHDYNLVDTVSTSCNGTVEYYECSICGDTYEKDLGGGDGKHDYVLVTTDATCTEPATIGYVCSICGEEDPANPIEEVGEALGHQAGTSDIEPADCENNAREVVYCTVCGEVISETDLYEATGETDESLKATGHEYGEAVYNGDGTHTQVCSVCEKENTSACLYVATGTTAATCTTGTVTTYTCSVCGNSYTAETGEADENAHNYVVEPIKEATCTTNGIGKLVCEYCGATDGYAIIPASHDYGEEITGIDENGNNVVFQICTVCGDVNILYIDDETAEPEHIYYTDDTDATCTEDAYTTIYCAYHEDEVETQVNAGTATGHTFDADSAEWAWAEDYSTATVTLTCTVCGDTEELEADVDATVISEATCTQEGETYYVAIVTDEAGNLYVDEKTVTTEKTEHSYISDVVTEATCVSEGEVVYICEICGDSYSETIPATGVHTYENGVCTVCGAEDPDYVAPHEHVYTSAVTKEATCTEEGEITYTCECGDSYTEVISATGHSYKLSYDADTDSYSWICEICGAARG